MVEAVQFIWLVLDLYTSGLDGPNPLLTCIRLALLACRLIHSMSVLGHFFSGPSPKANVSLEAMKQHAVAFCGKTHHQHSYLSYQRFNLYGVMAVKCLVLPRLLYLTHWNFTEARLDAIFSGYQATNGFTVWFKLLCLELLVIDFDRRFTAIVIIAIFFTQFPLMWPMFAKAPIPYVHLGGDIIMWVVGVWAMSSEKQSMRVSIERRPEERGTTREATA
eukprot:g1300.t1